MRILKIIIILAVGALSLFAAVYFTELYVSEVNAKDKTLAQVIIQNQLEAEMNKAEEQAKEELGEALVTTVMETKPVTTTTTTTAAATTVTTTTPATTTTTTTTTKASSAVTTTPLKLMRIIILRWARKMKGRSTCARTILIHLHIIRILWILTILWLFVLRNSTEGRILERCF